MFILLKQKPGIILNLITRPLSCDYIYLCSISEKQKSQISNQLLKRAHGFLPKKVAMYTIAIYNFTLQAYKPFLTIQRVTPELSQGKATLLVEACGSWLAAAGIW